MVMYVPRRIVSKILYTVSNRFSFKIFPKCTHEEMIMMDLNLYFSFAQDCNLHIRPLLIKISDITDISNKFFMQIFWDGTRYCRLDVHGCFNQKC
jgi:hypothetical protein